MQAFLIAMSYEELIKELQKATGLSRDEVVKMIYRKIEELGGLITEEAAVFLIAKELGIEFKKKESMLRKAELKIADLRPGMRNIVFSGAITKIEKAGDKVVAEVKDESNAKIKVIIPRGKLEKELKVGKFVRLICNKVERSDDGVLYVDVNEKNIIFSSEEEHKVQIVEEIEGVLVKKIDLGMRDGRYNVLLVLKVGEDYQSIKVSSGILELISSLKEGYRLKVKAIRRGNFIYAEADDIEVLKKENLDATYTSILNLNEIRPGLRYVDVKGKLAYISMLKKYITKDREIAVRDVLLEDNGTVVRARLKGTLAEEIHEGLKGRDIILRNVHIKASEGGLLIYTGRLSRLEIL